LRHVISVGPPRPGVLSFQDLVGGADHTLLPPPPVATDVAMMCYTSGTSAAPKAVPHSYQSLLANPRQCSPVFDLKPGDRILSAAPLTHAFGLFVVNVAAERQAGPAAVQCYPPRRSSSFLARTVPTAWHRRTHGGLTRPLQEPQTDHSAGARWPRASSARGAAPVEQLGSGE
jgi:cyclohexanecarboxylate-CoA ligase